MPATSSPSGPWQFAQVFRNTRPPSSMSAAVSCWGRAATGPPARSAAAISARAEAVKARIGVRTGDVRESYTVSSEVVQAFRPAHKCSKLSRLSTDHFRSCDVAVVGAGAAGLATAIFARRRDPDRSVLLLDGAKRPGAKILVSGGSRCNVTNAVVTDARLLGRPADDHPPDPARISRSRHGRSSSGPSASACTKKRTASSFPTASRRATCCARCSTKPAARRRRSPPARASLGVERDDGGFRLTTTRGDVHARRVVLATGGQSLPKSGSDGAGFEMARPPRAHHRADDAGARAAAARGRRRVDARELSGRRAPGRADAAGGRTPWRCASRGRCCGRTSASAGRSRSTCRGTGCAPGSRAVSRRSRRTSVPD